MIRNHWTSLSEARVMIESFKDDHNHRHSSFGSAGLLRDVAYVQRHEPVCNRTPGLWRSWLVVVLQMMPAQEAVRMRAFPARFHSGVRYWTVLDEGLAVVGEADAFLRPVRFGRDGSELTAGRMRPGSRCSCGDWLAPARPWHDGVPALGLFFTRLRHAGPQAWWCRLSTATRSSGV